jgi:hypothetical protein
MAMDGKCKVSNYYRESVKRGDNAIHFVRKFGAGTHSSYPPKTPFPGQEYQPMHKLSNIFQASERCSSPFVRKKMLAATSKAIGMNASRSPQMATPTAALKGYSNQHNAVFGNLKIAFAINDTPLRILFRILTMMLKIQMFDSIIYTPSDKMTAHHSHDRRQGTLIFIIYPVRILLISQQYNETQIQATSMILYPCKSKSSSAPSRGVNDSNNL